MKIFVISFILAFTLVSCGKKDKSSNPRSEQISQINNEPFYEENETFNFNQSELEEIVQRAPGIPRKFKYFEKQKVDYLKKLKHISFYGEIDDELLDSKEATIELEMRLPDGNLGWVILLPSNKIYYKDNKFDFNFDDKLLKKTIDEFQGSSFRLSMIFYKRSLTDGDINFVVYIPYE